MYLFLEIPEAFFATRYPESHLQEELGAIENEKSVKLCWFIYRICGIFPPIIPMLVSKVLVYQ